ncbi:hypothetical protein BKA70DRAFT_1420328 [Coprinopsis sp. MPI-PUGE-AT-0042]|nr:hypothetical protein BKA70DRAFT_1420328 [Coprinopsis sp. MPI-PUGE-AT-0042]
MARSHSDYLQSITSTKRAPSPSGILNSTNAVYVIESAYAADYAPLDRGEGSSSTSIIAADPCERCVRAGRTCRGPSGSRCEHCKRLKQKCSNSSISLRGKHAARAAAQTAPGDATRPTQALINGPLTAHPASLKRKDRDDTPSESANYSTIDEDADENCGVVPARQDKKRRIQKEVERRNAIVAGKVIKHVDELGDCIKRLQDTYTQEMARVGSIMAALEEDMAQYLPEDHHTMPDSAASH